jgi:hypothetical protein
MALFVAAVLIAAIIMPDPFYWLLISALCDTRLYVRL